MIIGTSASASSTFVNPPVVDLPPVPSALPKVDLRHVAYYRDNTEYEVLLKALMQKVSTMQKNLATLSSR